MFGSGVSAVGGSALLGAVSAKEASELARDGAETARDEAEALLDLVTQVGTAQLQADWATLTAVTGADGDWAIVLADAGTHTDPVVGGLVANEGIYKWVVSPAGWQRIADTGALRASDKADEAAASATSAADQVTAALNLTKLSLYGQADDIDAAIILDFAPDQYLGKVDTIVAGERVNAMVKTDLGSGPSLLAKDLSSFATFARSTTATRINSAGLVESVSPNVARIDYHPVTKECLGYLRERASANLLVRSSAFDNAAWVKASGATITTAAGVAPDGTTTANRLNNFNSPTGRRLHQVVVSGATFASTTFSGSIWVKAENPADVGKTVSFSLIRSSNTTNVTQIVVGVLTLEWQRLSATFTTLPDTVGVEFRLSSSAGSPATFLIWGAQLEARASSTSYIPTVASQVTRSGDAISFADANVTQWLNEPAGCFVIDYSYQGGSSISGNSQVVLQVDNGSTPTSKHLLYNLNGLAATYVATKDSVNQASLSEVDPSASGVAIKTAFAYNANDFALSHTGNAVLTDNTGEVPTGLNRMLLGAENFVGHIKSVKYFSSRLSNEKLQELSA